MRMLPAIAVAGMFLLLSGSSKSKKSDKKGSVESNKIDPISGVNLSKDKNRPSGRPTCKSTEFFNPVTDKCEAFWIEGETDAMVAEAIDNEINNLLETNSWDEKTNYSDLCEDKVTPGNKNNNWKDVITPNKNITTIMENVIYDLWNGAIPKDKLPPGKNSPEWVKEIWKRVGAIYYLNVCNVQHGSL